MYHALLADPLEDGDQIMFTLDEDGRSNWDRTTELPPPEEELVAAVRPAPIKSSVKQLDYSDLWSLATTSKLLYTEATPVIYANTCLKYTVGDSLCVNQDPTLLHSFLAKLPAPSWALCRHLTIINNQNADGKALSAKDMNTIVDLLNLRLPNLVSLEIRAIDPMTEPWIDDNPPEFVQDHLQIMAAARPVARLASGPKVTLKSRVCFYLEPDRVTFDPDITFVLKLMKGLMVQHVTPTLVDIKNWRRQAREYHALSCQGGGYLQLTSIMRSEVVEDTQLATATDIDDVEAVLVKRDKALGRIEECKHWRMLFDGCLRKISS